MSVIISKHPSRAAELLEYLSLIRYAAKYQSGLGWCVYDVKFRQKAAANKFIKWSTIDSQLWLKTFTVAPLLMKEELGFFQSGPSSPPSTVKGNEYALHSHTDRVFVNKMFLELREGDRIGYSGPGQFRFTLILRWSLQIYSRKWQKGVLRVPSLPPPI